MKRILKYFVIGLFIFYFIGWLLIYINGEQNLTFSTLIIALLVLTISTYFVLNMLKNSKPKPVQYSNDEYIYPLGGGKKTRNSLYSVVCEDGFYNYDVWQDAKLFLFKENRLVYQINFRQVDEYTISDDGIVVCCASDATNELGGQMIIITTDGKKIFDKKVSANLVCCDISKDSEIAIFETASSETDDGDCIYIIDVKSRTVVSKFEKPAQIRRISKIDTVLNVLSFKGEDRILYHFDFRGNELPNV